MRRRRNTSALVSAGLLVLALLAPTASAQEPSTTRDWKRRFDNTFAFVLNPLGIQDEFAVSWTKSITNSQRLIVKDAHLAFGVSSKLTPAFERVSGWVEYSPLSILDLRVGVEPVYYFGTYKAFLRFDRADADFSDDVIRARQSEAASGFANRVYLAPTLKARAGSFIARAHVELSYWNAPDKGFPFFYEPAWDTLIKSSGSEVVTLEALVLHESRFEGDKSLLIGPAYDSTKVKDAAVNKKQDVGLLAVFAKAGPLRFAKDPALVAKAVYFLKDPWRRHEFAAQFVVTFGL